MGKIADGFLNTNPMSKADFKEYVRGELWDTVLDEIRDSPTKYFDPANYSFDEIMDGFYDIIFNGKTLTPGDFIALQEEYNFTYVSRRLVDEEPSNGLVSRDLESRDECTEILLDATLNFLVLALSFFGLRPHLGRQFVNGIKGRHVYKITGSSKFGPAFRLSFVRAGGKLGWDYFVSAIITFFTSLSWQAIEDTIREAFSMLDRIKFGLTILLELLAIYTTGGWIVAAKVGAMLPSAEALFSGVIDFLQNDCFGELQSTDCDGFQEAGYQGTTTSVINMKQTSGNFQIQYEMYGNPDQMTVRYEDEEIYSTGGLVQYSDTVDLSFSGDSQLIEVVMYAPNDGTEWKYSVSCPE